MQQIDEVEFADAWCTAWNSHDVDAILSHFTDDVVFTSPVAAQILPETQGILRGKTALHAYWTAALVRVPNLKFEVLNVYTGIDHLVINYRNHVSGLVNEVLRFSGSLVVEGHGTYVSANAASASGIQVDPSA